MKVSELLKLADRPVITIGTEETIQTAIDKLVEHNIGALPVCDEDNTVLGIITERDLLKESSLRIREIGRTQVREIMTKELAICTEEDELNYVMDTMTQLRIRHMPIMRDLKLAGIISSRDIIESQLEDSKAKIRFLSDYTQLLTAIFHYNQTLDPSK